MALSIYAYHLVAPGDAWALFSFSWKWGITYFPKRRMVFIASWWGVDGLTWMASMSSSTPMASYRSATLMQASGSPMQ